MGRRHMRFRKRSLQVNSIKKRDNMLVTVIESDDGTVIGEPGDPVAMVGNEIYGFLFAASARDWESFDTIYGRRRSTVFARGYREKSIMEVTNGTGWLWRRIVFAAKSQILHDAFPDGTLSLNLAQHGWVRPLYNFLGGGVNANAARDVLEGILFKGESGADWVDRFSASIDRTRVQVLSDNVRQLTSGTVSGRFFNAKNWYPINRTIAYDEDESGLVAGGNKTNNRWSATGSVGIGDVYVYDIFACAGSDGTSTLNWEPQGGWFWHER